MGLSTRNSAQSPSEVDSSASDRKKWGIAIKDLNPASFSQSDDSLWWFQNQI
jgi:hypothetical protein